ncbi:hypothetical protein ACJX0J_025106, partial [Zea mays]
MSELLDRYFQNVSELGIVSTIEQMKTYDLFRHHADIIQHIRNKIEFQNVCELGIVSAIEQMKTYDLFRHHADIIQHIIIQLAKARNGTFSTNQVYTTYPNTQTFHTKLYST